MDAVSFFKPTIPTVIIFIVLFILTFMFLPTIYMGGPARFGYPMSFFTFGGCYGPPAGPPINCWNTEIYSWSSFIIDIIIWYLVSCVIVTHKNRKK